MGRDDNDGMRTLLVTLASVFNTCPIDYNILLKLFYIREPCKYLHLPVNELIMYLVPVLITKSRIALPEMVKMFLNVELFTPTK